MTQEITTLLGEDSQFEGKLTFQGIVRVEGRFSGEITSSGTLVIGPQAEVSAEVSVGTCVVEGRFHGNLTASEFVEIHPPGHVRGKIVTPEIQVDRGVILDGQCIMETGTPLNEEPQSVEVDSDFPSSEGV